MGINGIWWDWMVFKWDFVGIYSDIYSWDLMGYNIGGLNQPQVAWFHSWTSTLKFLDNYGISYGKLKDLVDHELLPLLPF